MSELENCPFCGERPKIDKHFRENLYCLVHRCKVLGCAISMDWNEKNYLIEKWNTRHG